MFTSSIQCRVIEIDEKLDGTRVDLGFPDENGKRIVLDGITHADAKAFEEGGFYNLAFVPVEVVAQKATETVAQPASADTTASSEPAGTVTEATPAAADPATTQEASPAAAEQSGTEQAADTSAVVGK